MVKFTDNISHQEIQFWLPVIISTIAIVSSFTIYMVRISILETKVDQVIALLEKHDTRETKLVDNLNDLNHRLSYLEGKTK